MALQRVDGDSWFDDVLADLHAALERDPAARGWLDVVLSYPGFHALVAHRLIHPLYRAGVPFLPRFLANIARFLTQIEIHPAAKIGKGVFIDHGSGVVIGETAELGDGCTIYQGVTLGGTSLSHGKRHPTLGRNVIVGVNSSVLGAIVLGDNAKVGGGSVVVKDVPANATVVGVRLESSRRTASRFASFPNGRKSICRIPRPTRSCGYNESLPNSKSDWLRSSKAKPPKKKPGAG